VSEHELIGAYVLGVLDDEEQATVRAHLSDCESCRREVDELLEMEAALGEIPPEALLDGPPPEGDGVLRRTLADVRGERRRRRGLWVLAAAVIAIAALAGGIAAGRLAGSSSSPVAPVPVAAPLPAHTATDPDTGATMAVSLTPAYGWVRLHATLSGVPAGSQCRIFVVSADGAREQAASWLAGDRPATVDGAAIMAPADVKVVQAETYAGQILVAVPI
jgi:predicted anti-sigma-YlaC factor YlaD